jgi:acetyl-CoA acetyltransferase
MSTTIAIPYGAYWCTPFARWQGSLAHLHSLRFAARVAGDALAARAIALSEFDYGVLGMTVPQRHCFYGLPWLTGEMGAAHIGGPTIMQACATSARVLVQAAQEIASGAAACALTITADRVSNGPHLYYPNPLGAGGTGETEDWVLGNFERDPLAGCNMLATAENCARRWRVSREEQHALVLRRYAQYLAASVPDAEGRTFQSRYMVTPLAVPDQRGKRVVATLSADEGVQATTADGLARLAPVLPDGSVTFGAQTHPADGNAGMVVTTPARAKALSRDAAVRIEIIASGQSRTELAYMPAAPIAAAQRALASANLTVKDLAAIKSHNPFAVNDIIFARETGADLEAMNNYGCSLIWGHPQAPTGMRAIIELIEELVQLGGGYGLFHGCAAGDTAMAVVVRVH